MQSSGRQFSLILPALSLAHRRTTVLPGAVHLVIFGAYIVTTVLP
jgi:Ca2+/H+ antiporter